MSDVTRTPFFFTSAGQPLFAWLHRPRMPSGYAIVLCPPHGYEQVHAQRTLRHWADALARAGAVVLRLDYFGTGDAAGIDESPNLLENWLTNIRDAVTWLRTNLHVEQIGLWGMRLGATLAMKVAVELPVDSLVLWAPVLKGRLYVREMKALSLTAQAQAEPLPDAPNDIEAAGFVLTSAVVEDLAKLDVFQLRPGCGRALILARDDVPADTRLLDHLTGLGIRAEQLPVPGYVDMLAEPHYTRVPTQAIEESVRWLLTEPLAPAAITDEPDCPAQTDIAADIRERVFFAGAERNLFALISEPTSGPGADLPTILLINAGAAYHVGPNRLYVLLARRLASVGFRVVRLDLAGLGESVAFDPRCENETYPASAFGDIAATLQSLQATFGVARVVLMGLCSGAYFAFQSAVQFHNPLLIESILINPLTYFWREGMSLNAPADEEVKNIHYYLGAAMQPRKWLRFLSGRTKIGFIGALGILWRRLRIGSARPSAASSVITPNAVVGHPAQDNLPADLNRFATTGRHLGCFFARSDPGSSLLLLRARKQVDRLVHAGKMEIHYLENADHTFSARVPRRRFLDAITAYLCRRYPSGPAS